jgi:hypothetical protein
MKLVPPGSSRLRRFQEHFARALVDQAAINDCGAGVARLVGQPGFAVYRNTVLKGCIDALVANFPAVTRLVGEEWMRAAASVFARANLPQNPMLLDYGTRFPAFLAAFEPAAELPYLPDVARLDRFWTEAHGARDEAAVQAEAVSALAHDELAGAVLHPHPSARWAWFDAQPIFSLWARNRSEGCADEGEIPWRGEGALVVRPVDEVHWFALERGEAAFLDACGAGWTLADAAMAAVNAEPGIDLSQTMARLLAAGAFGQLSVDRP